MAFSFKNALNSVVNAAKSFIAPKKQVQTKPPSNNFINNSIAPAKTLIAPKITPPAPKPLTTVGQVLSSVNNPLTNKSTNPLSSNVSTNQSNQQSGANNTAKYVGNKITDLGNWIDKNVRTGSGSIIGEGINTLGKFGGYFEKGGTTVPMGGYTKLPTPKIDFSQMLQNLGSKIVKKASASEFGGSGVSSNTPTGSYLPGQNASYPNSSIMKPDDKKQAVYAVASLPDGSTKMSDGTIRKGTNEIFDKAKGNYDQFVDDKNPTIDTGEEGYVALNDQINGIMNEYSNGNLGEEEARNKMAEAQRRYIESQYNSNKANAEALIPEYEQFRDKALGDITTNLSEVKSNAVKTKETTSNTYGDILRRATENKRYTDAQRRNQFSALGTADSSAFIENQTRADSSFGSDNNRTEREMADKLSGIDTEVMKAEKSAEDQSVAIKNDASSKIMAVKRSINASDEEKRNKIEEINAQLYADLTGLAQDLSDKKAGLLSTQLELSGNLQAIREQGNVDINTQKAIANLSNSNAAGNIPADLQSELQGFTGAPRSGYSANLKKMQLKSAYPAYADYIEQIFNPLG